MTRDEILNMPAGPDMDLLVADKLALLPREVINARGFEKQGEWMVGVLPSYSTNISAAWTVVEKLRLMIRPSILAGKWVVMRFERVYLSGKWEGDGEVTAETAPLAVCRAALIEAVTVETARQEAERG